MLRARIRAALRKSKTTTGQLPGSVPVRLIMIDPPGNHRKSGNFSIDTEKLISTLVVIAIFVVVVIFNEARLRRKALELKNFPRYTIGITLQSRKTRSGRYVDYKYYVHGSRYIGIDPYPFAVDSINVSGGRYFVKYSARNPGNAKMLFDHPVADSIADAPDSGWTSPPVSLPGGIPSNAKRPFPSEQPLAYLSNQDKTFQTGHAWNGELTIFPTQPTVPSSHCWRPALRYR
jgi:hypothetical protein